MENEGKIILDKAAGKADRYIRTKRPSRLLPFQGTFPLLKDYDVSGYKAEIDAHPYLEQCSDWVQSVVKAGSYIYEVEDSFRQYLNNIGIKEQDFIGMKSSEKADILVKFMSKEGITFDQLKIKVKQRNS